MKKLLLLLSLLCVVAAPAVSALTPEEEFHERLRHRLEVLLAPGELEAGGEVLYGTRVLQALYDARGYRPLWFDGVNTRPALRNLAAAIAAAEAEGLDPEHYHLRVLTELLATLREREARRRDPRVLTDVELLASDAFLTLAKHYADGRIDPTTVDPGWFLSREDSKLIPVLERAAEADSPQPELADLLPPQSEYAALRARLKLQRKLDSNGVWAEIPAGPTLRRGDAGARVEALRQRLLVLGDLDEQVGVEGDFDTALDAAVRRFQARHGLEADGLVGRNTLAALNVSPERRIEQLRANMERWRWLPADLGQEHILVNIAGFYMDVVSGAERIMRQRVIVGKPYRRTPVFTGNMTYLVLNPSWEVPHTLAVQDQLPQIRRDPAYLERMGFTVLRGWGAQERVIDPKEVNWAALGPRNFPFRLRQGPGPLNALGRVKFMFPNRHNVYLHDTPARGLFAREERAFSSGCIRVEDPMALTEWLLGGSGRPRVMDSAQINRVLERGNETTVRFRALPVHLLYWTAWVEEDGRVHYRGDIYERDSALIEALNRASPGEV